MKHPNVKTLSALLDGDLNAGESKRVRDHVNECTVCRNELDGLRSLVVSLRDLPDRRPENNLWPGIQDGLAPTSPRPKVWMAAAAAVLVLAIVGTWFWLQRLPSQGATPVAALATDELEQARIEGYLEAIRDVEGLLDEMDSALDPASTRLVRDELLVLDEAIAELRQALQSDPDNLWLRERLARSLHSKWTYLREATELVPRRFGSGG